MKQTTSPLNTDARPDDSVATNYCMCTTTEGAQHAPYYEQTNTGIN